MAWHTVCALKLVVIPLDNHRTFFFCSMLVVLPRSINNLHGKIPINVEKMDRRLRCLTKDQFQPLTGCCTVVFKSCANQRVFGFAQERQFSDDHPNQLHRNSVEMCNNYCNGKPL